MKSIKQRKQRKGIIKNPKRQKKLTETRSNQLVVGKYGLKVLQYGRISTKQIEAARRTIRRFLKRTGTLTIRIFPNVPVTLKPAEVRMGKGKGAIDHWVCIVKPGRILFELDDSIPLEFARKALKKGSIKLPLLTAFTTLRKTIDR